MEPQIAPIEQKYEINEDTQMRDALIGRLYDLSKTDPRIIFSTADMGATALDKWRERESILKDGRFTEFGIAEQAMASVAAGLAKEGKRPFIYAIGNFVTKRIHEFHVLNAGLQKLPYVTVGIGTGFGYPDSGPTHYMTEDVSIMRAIPNLEIISPSDAIMTAKFAETVSKANNPVYLRLERGTLPVLYSEEDTFERGFTELKEGRDIVVIGSGLMLHQALDVAKHFKERGKDIGIIDLYRIKPLNKEGLIETLKKYKKAITYEEHLLDGGIGSIFSELITDNDLQLKLHRIGIKDKFVYFYGRENIQKQLGIDKQALVEVIEKNH